MSRLTDEKLEREKGFEFTKKQVNPLAGCALTFHRPLFVEFTVPPYPAQFYLGSVQNRAGGGH
jgi:hypothetical protein